MRSAQKWAPESLTASMCGGPQWKDGDADGLGRQERGAIYDMVHLVFTREKLLTDWGHPCPERDRCVG